MIYYSQCDKRWASHKLGTCTDTFCKSGCYLMCLSSLSNLNPDECNRRLKTRGEYYKGCLVSPSNAAYILCLKYSSVRSRAMFYPCIAETDHFRLRGIPQHFFLLLSPTRMVDPLTGRESNLKYKIKSYRNLTTKIKEATMTKEQEAVIANLRKEDVWPFHKAGTTSKNLLAIYSRDYVDSLGGTKKFNEKVLTLGDTLKQVELLKKTNKNLGIKLKELSGHIETLEKEINKLVDNKKGDIMGKNWFQSKTIWFGILFIIVAIANVFGFGDFEPATYWNEIITAIIGFVTIWFRKTTNTPVK